MTIHCQVNQTPSWSCQVILKLIWQWRSQNLKFASIQHEVAKVHLEKTKNLLLSTKHSRHLKNWMICSNHIIKIMQTRKDTRSRVSWRDGASKFSRKFNVFCACVTIFTLHHTFPHSCLYLHQSLGDLGTPLSLHIFQLLLIAYSGVAMHSTAQQCTVCLLMHSTLTYMQPSCTLYKDIMDTHFQ